MTVQVNMSDHSLIWSTYGVVKKRTMLRVWLKWLIVAGTGLTGLSWKRLQSGSCFAAGVLLEAGRFRDML